MIWVKNPTGVFCGVEVKEDQGVVKMGKILTSGFKMYRKARELISLGTLERIGKDINDCFCYYDETCRRDPDINHYYFIDNTWYVKKGFLFKQIKDLLR